MAEERKVYRYKIEELKRWKESEERKPLIITGARQVGKTWLMKEFGKNYYEKCAYINFEDNSRMQQLFSEGFNIDRIIHGLKMEARTNIEPGKTLIIFDEIQENPKALNALKYFYEQSNEYHIIAAGSLLGLAIHEGKSFPVGKVDFLNLYPLSFYEFLWAIGETDLVKLIKSGDINLINASADKLKSYLKQYIYIGGMPEIVNLYAKNRDLEEVRRKQEILLESYGQDFSKHAPNNLIPKIRQIWNNIPTQLAKENKEIINSFGGEVAKVEEYETALSWLIDCGLVYQVNRVNDCKVPLSAYKDFNAFKLYLFDVGLLCAMANIDAKIILEGNDIFIDFEGALTEQLVVNELKNNITQEVFYWSESEGKKEATYVIQLDGNNIPIEVKQNEKVELSGLKAFIEKYNTNINIRTSMDDYKEEKRLINVPLYLIGDLREILKDK